MQFYKNDLWNITYQRTGFELRLKHNHERFLMNYVKQKFYNVLVSIAQGRPDATIQFNMVHHIFIACLESAPIRRISLKIDNNHIPCFIRLIVV